MSDDSDQSAWHDNLGCAIVLIAGMFFVYKVSELLVVGK